MSGSYFVNDDARRNIPLGLPRYLPQHSDFHEEHAELMSGATTKTVADTTSPDCGWFNSHLSDKEAPKPSEGEGKPALAAGGEMAILPTAWELD